MFALILGVVFAVWWRSQRTLSIHSITTRRRELFSWLAILTTFALGTASGDWILKLTGWSPGISVLLPAGLIIAVVVGWRLGANAVLSFWLAYILTRPLGANLGDWIGFPASDGGLGLGVGLTSIIFLTAILATVIYLSVTRVDTSGNRREATRINTTTQRERVMIGYFLGVAAIVTGPWCGQPRNPTAPLLQVRKVPPRPSPSLPAKPPRRTSRPATSRRTR